MKHINKTWYMKLYTRNWYVTLDTRNLIHETWYMKRGTWNLTHLAKHETKKKRNKGGEKKLKESLKKKEI